MFQLTVNDFTGVRPHFAHQHVDSDPAELSLFRAGQYLHVRVVEFEAGATQSIADCLQEDDGSVRVAHTIAKGRVSTRSNRNETSIERYLSNRMPAVAAK